MTNEEFIKEVSLKGEEWRDVVGYEGLYVVSNMGRIASFNKRSGFKIMATPIMHDGYIYVCLYKNKRHKYRLHRIIAEAWIPNPNNYPCVEHLDASRTNNIVSNLRWCTHSMNINNPITLYRESFSTRKDKSKSMEIVCLRDREFIKVYPYLSKVKEDGHYVCGVWKVLKKMKKHHHGMTWMYLSDYENLKSTSQRATE